MATEKMLIHESHKNLTNVSFHISTVRGIEPNNLSISSLVLGCTCNICDIFIKSTIFKSNIVIRSCFIEVTFITKVLRNSITNHWWNLINYWWRVAKIYFMEVGWISTYYPYRKPNDGLLYLTVAHRLVFDTDSK